MSPVTLTIMARVCWGLALIGAPGRLLHTLDPVAHDRRDRIVARVLGGRHLAQAAVGIALPGEAVRRFGALVDGVHAASAIGLASVDGGHRRLALLDATIAATFSAAGAISGSSSR